MVTPAGILDDGVVEVEGDLITAVRDAGGAAVRGRPPADGWSGSCPASSTSMCTAAAAPRSRPAIRPRPGSRPRSTPLTARRRCWPAWSPPRPTTLCAGGGRAGRPGRRRGCSPASIWRARTCPRRAAVPRIRRYLRDPDLDELAASAGSGTGPHGDDRSRAARRVRRRPAAGRPGRDRRHRAHRRDVRADDGPRSRPAPAWRPTCATRCARSTTATRVRSSPCWTLIQRRLRAGRRRRAPARRHAARTSYAVAGRRPGRAGDRRHRRRRDARRRVRARRAGR